MPDEGMGYYFAGIILGKRGARLIYSFLGNFVLFFSYVKFGRVKICCFDNRKHFGWRRSKERKHLSDSRQIRYFSHIKTFIRFEK